MEHSADSRRRLLGCGGIAAVLLLIFGYIFSNGHLLDDPSGGLRGETFSTETGWYEIYFTDPTCPPPEERAGGLDELIATDLRAAQIAVDVASLEIDSDPLVDALVELEDRGIPVRIVTDADYGDERSLRRLRRGGISVVEDTSSAFMHNKFIVIDGLIVWTGSMNLTSNGIYCNNNTVVRLQSPQLAANYRAEMTEMYDERQFGASSPQNTPHEKLSIDGVALENYFGPETMIVPRLSAELTRAESEILFLAFSFTNEDIGEQLIDRARDGIEVRGVFERSGAGSVDSYYGAMVASDMPNLQVRRDGNPNAMHHKLFIVDRATVIFGSFNFSANANRFNDENVLIVHDPTFAAYFVEEFERVWDEAGSTAIE